MSRQDEQFLAHFGVLGMKWGRRKARDKTGGSASSEKSVTKAPSKSSEKPVRADPKSLSMEELKKANDRFEAEKKYRQYIADLNAKKEGRLKKFAKDMLESTAKTFLETAIKKQVNNLFGVQPETAAKGKKVVDEILKDTAKKPSKSTKEETEAVKEVVKKGKKKVKDILDALDASAGF